MIGGRFGKAKRRSRFEMLRGQNAVAQSLKAYQNSG